MSNADTVKAVITNLSAILTGLSYPVEDTSADPEIKTPFAQIDYQGEDFDNEYGQRPEYNDIKLVVRVQFQAKTPALGRGTEIDITHDLRGGITVDAINVGDLLASKLVSFVMHNGDDVIHEGAVSIVHYRLTIQYREL